ncbi:hypothetical protein D3C86_1852400 [compost metagenome]
MRIVGMQDTQVEIFRAKINLRQQRIMIAHASFFLIKVSIDMHNVQCRSGRQLIVDQHMIQRLGIALVYVGITLSQRQGVDQVGQSAAFQNL